MHLYGLHVSNTNARNKQTNKKKKNHNILTMIKL